MASSLHIEGTRVGSPRHRTGRVAAHACVPIHPPLPPALERMFGLVSQPVLKLESSEDGQLTLREISILLGDILDLLEEDQAILHAADELYEAAFVLQDARERQSTCVSITKSIVATRTKVLHAALVGFRASLGLAKPNARARVRQLAW
jgi:hypothetical protein